MEKLKTIIIWALSMIVSFLAGLIWLMTTVMCALHEMKQPSNRYHDEYRK